MPLSKYDTHTAREKLEQRIVHGLACEWELALGIFKGGRWFQNDLKVNISVLHGSLQNVSICLMFPLLRHQSGHRQQGVLLCLESG